MSDQNNESSKPTDEKKNWWDNLDQSQQQHINEGLKNTEEGRVHSSSVFWEKLRNQL